MDTSILNVLSDGVTAWLQQELADSVEGDIAGDNAKAGLVQAGKLQQDPTLTLINIMVHPGGDDWPHELNKQDDGPGLYGPTYEMGGQYAAEEWRRRFLIQLNMFFQGEYDRDVARAKAQVVLSRAQHALRRMPIPATVDDFGESAYAISTDSGYITEGGGEGTFIWRGELKIEFLTHVEPQ